MKRLFCLLIILTLSGCASFVVVSSTPRTVVISGANANNTAATQMAADAECQKNGRWAVHIPDSQRDGIVTYECKE